jgi:membrane-bound ClpP family serine protease
VGAGVAEPASVAEKRALVGALGRALTDLRPVGKVELEGRGGADFEARTEGPALDRGARVRVVGVSSGRLVVERAPAGSSPAGSSPAGSSKGEPG